MCAVESNWKCSRQTKTPWLCGRCCPCDLCIRDNSSVTLKQGRAWRNLGCHAPKVEQGPRGPVGSWIWTVECQSLHFTFMLCDASSRDDAQAQEDRRETQSLS